MIPSSKFLVPIIQAWCSTVREGNPNRKERKESDHIELVSMTIQPGEEMVVGKKLREILSAAKKGKSAA